MRRESSYPDVLTMDEACMFLRCTRPTMSKLANSGLFPNAYHIGRRWRIPKEDLIEYRRCAG